MALLFGKYLRLVCVCAIDDDSPGNAIENNTLAIMCLLTLIQTRSNFAIREKNTFLMGFKVPVHLVTSLM